MASLDEYFKKRMGGVESPTGPTTTSPAAPVKTDPASSYIDRISQTLGGRDPVVQNARQEASTKNAVGDYLANRQAKQESVGAGYTPGTLQSQRTADRYQAGANEAALTRDAGVNDLARERTDTAMSQANQLRQEGVQEIETLIKSVPDPVTQAYLRRIQAAGGDVKAALAGNLANKPSGSVPTDPNGTTNPTVQPGQTTPGATNIDPATGLPISETPAQLAQESATDWVKTLHPEMDPNSQEFKELVNARVGGADEAALRTITDANKAAKIKDAQTAASSNFAGLTPEQQTLLLANTPAVNPMSVPIGKAAFDTFAQTKPIVQIGGKLYKPVRTMEFRIGKDRDFSVFEAPDGSYLYVDKSGRTTTNPAPPGSRPSTRKAWLESFK